jgi:hypothetical protein
MAKSQRRRTDTLVTMPTAQSFAAFSDSDIATRAYELYQRRGSEHGHDAEDWSLAEHELRRDGIAPVA